MAIRLLTLVVIIASLIASCNSKSCPEDCIRITGFVKDSSTNGGAANLPYEVYWVKKRTISKYELIDTGSTDANGRMDKSFEIDKGRFENQRIFVRLLPNENYLQANGTYITQAIEKDVPSAELNFTVLQSTDLTIILNPKDPDKKYPRFLLTYEYDGAEYKAYADAAGLNKTEHKVRTAAGVVTRVTAFTPNPQGILKRHMDSIVCEAGKPNTITMAF